MNILKSIICPCLMAFPLIFAGAATAEIRAEAMTLSPSVGGYVFEGNQDLDNTVAYGLGLGYNLDRHWAAEATVHYMNSEYDGGGRDVNVWLYHLDALYHFVPTEKLVPYVATGIGGITFDPDQGHNDKDFAVNYGAGLKYFLTEEIALRGDVRHVVSFSSVQSNLLYTLGLTFSFGGVGETTGNVSQISPTPENEDVAIVMASEPSATDKVRAASVQRKTVVLGFEDVHFDFGESNLKPEAQMILKRNVEILKENPAAHIRIAGYTSAAGTEEYNQSLSERRARAVQDFLVEEGVIEPERLSIIGYGETDPAREETYPLNIDSNAAKANMRVLFEIEIK